MPANAPLGAPHGTQDFPFKSFLLLLLFLLHAVAIAQANELLDFNELVPRYEKAVRKGQSSIAAHMNLGFVYLGVGSDGPSDT